MSTGMQLKLARIRADLKQIEVAQAAGTTAARLSLIEHGRVRASPKMLDRIRKGIERASAAKAESICG